MPDYINEYYTDFWYQNNIIDCGYQEEQSFNKYEIIDNNSQDNFQHKYEIEYHPIINNDYAEKLNKNLDHVNSLYNNELRVIRSNPGYSEPTRDSTLNGNEFNTDNRCRPNRKQNRVSKQHDKKDSGKYFQLQENFNTSPNKQKVFSMSTEFDLYHYPRKRRSMLGACPKNYINYNK